MAKISAFSFCMGICLFIVLIIMESEARYNNMQRQRQKQKQTGLNFKVKPGVELTPVGSDGNSFQHLTVNLKVGSNCCNITDPCTPNPCMNSGVCSTFDNGKDYICNCPYPLGGNQCENLHCSTYTLCNLVHHTVYFLHRYANVSFQEAVDYCHSLNQTLATFPDEYYLKEVGEHLRKVYYKDPTNRFSAWIGLNRTSTAAKWKWIDGTELTYFTSWAPSSPNSALCASLSNGYGFEFNMADDDCSGNANWVHFPFCQQTYSFINTS